MYKNRKNFNKSYKNIKDKYAKTNGSNRIQWN